MTCEQLGGPCEHARRGESANDVIKLRDRHLRESVRGGDEQHRPAATQMKDRWKHPIQGLGWYRDAQRTFAALPEN